MSSASTADRNFLPPANRFAETEEGNIEPPKNLEMGAEGTVEIRFRLPETISQLPGEPKEVPVLELPGLCRLVFIQQKNQAGVFWIWDKAIPRSYNLRLVLPEVPGNEPLHGIFTWDFSRGLFLASINGIPLRASNVVLEPTSCEPVHEAVLYDNAGIEEIAMSRKFTVEVADWKPTALQSPWARAMGAATLEPFAGRRGKLLYENRLALALDVAAWKLEGPGKVGFHDGWMTLSSLPVEEIKGHIVFWCEQEFPPDFLAEWDVEILGKNGLCIVFFAARGRKGEDLFDSQLAARDGTFSQYHSGDIDCYHISYFANNSSGPGRITSNIRKNHGFHLVGNGPSLVTGADKTVHRVQLLKQGGLIQLAVDGKMAISIKEETALGAGKIGFRQMEETVARYRNLRVYEPALPSRP